MGNRFFPGPHRMHQATIRQEIIDRVTARRGRFHVFDRFEASETALVVIDMQPTFVAEGSPAETAMSREIVPGINALAAAMRAKGAAVIWVTHANARAGDGTDWDAFFDNFVADAVRARTAESLRPGSPDTQLWHLLETGPDDIHLIKNRYSALIPGSSPLERTLRSRGIRNLLIAGVKTNVCCEATARDAMMMDFNVAMVADCCAALSDDEHRAALETFIQQFGDVVTRAEAETLVC